MPTSSSTAFALLIAASLLIHLIGTEQSARKRHWVASIALVSCLGVAVVADFLRPPALPVIAALLSCAALIVSPYPNRIARVLAWTVAITLVLALGFRILPGFERIPLGPASGQGESQSLPAEKLLLMAALPLLVRVPWGGDWRRIGIISASVAAATIAAVVPIGLYLGFASPGLRTFEPGVAVSWLIYNLLAVCILEEAFFRGILQPGLARMLRHRWDHGRTEIAAVVATAALFSLAHFGGGVGWMTVAFIAGCGYGAAAMLARCLWPAVLVHFAVNAVHFLAFAGVV